LRIGTIVKLSNNGFGVIAGDAKEVFFHRSAVERVRFAQLEEGQAVEYELYTGRAPLHVGYCGGPQAVSVRPA